MYSYAWWLRSSGRSNSHSLIFLFFSFHTLTISSSLSPVILYTHLLNPPFSLLSLPCNNFITSFTYSMSFLFPFPFSLFFFYNFKICIRRTRLDLLTFPSFPFPFRLFIYLSFCSLIILLISFSAVHWEWCWRNFGLTKFLFICLLIYSPPIRPLPYEWLMLTHCTYP